MNDFTKALLLVIATGIITWALTDLLDKSDAGADAETKAIAVKVVSEMTTLPDGTTYGAALDANTKELIKINTQLPFIRDALEALSEE